MLRGSPNIFPNVHSRYSGKFRGKDIPNPKVPKNKQESRFVRCIHCNAINDTIKRPKGDGWGGNISYEDAGLTATIMKPVVGGAGCWFCGASEYY